MLDRCSSRRQRPHRPATRAGEEAESAGFVGRDLGTELTGCIKQPHVRTGDRKVAPTDDDPLDDRLPAQVHAVERHAAGWCRTALGHARPGSSPIAIGTPTSEPYSVHD